MPQRAQARSDQKRLEDALALREQMLHDQDFSNWDFYVRDMGRLV